MPLLEFGYESYDKSGNMLGVVDATLNYPSAQASKLRNTWSYGYDGLGRLVGADTTNTAWAQPTASYEYDWMSNMTVGRDLVFAHQPGAPHQIQTSTRAGTPSAPFDYDANGALELRPAVGPAAEDGAIEFAYDAEGRVRRVTAGSDVVEYVSDSSGQRVARRTADGAVTFYFGPRFEVTGTRLVRHVPFAGRIIAASEIELPASSPLVVARIDAGERGTMTARALLDFAAESPRLYPRLALARQDAVTLFALALLAIILLDLVPGRARVGLSSARGSRWRRLRRGHVLALLAVFSASLTPLAYVRPASATGGGGSGGGGSPPPPSYPVYFLHHDHLGSTVMATCYKRPVEESCADGEVKQHFRYDAYGLTKAFDATGTPLTNPATHASDRLYTGQRWEATARVYDYNARFYEPRVARFASIDPAREFPNPYAYVGWRPTHFVDPTGLWMDLPFGFDLPFDRPTGPVPYFDVKSALEGGANNGQNYSAGGAKLDAGFYSQGTSTLGGFYATLVGILAVALLPLGLATTAVGAVAGGLVGGVRSGSLGGALGGAAAGALTAATIHGTDVRGLAGGIVGHLHGITTGAAGMIKGAATLDASTFGNGAYAFLTAVVMPRHDSHGAINWPGTESNVGLIPGSGGRVNNGSIRHDADMQRHGFDSSVSHFRWIENAWVGPGTHPGLYGNVYRGLGTVGFGVAGAILRAAGR
jgi:RHS repeat-associated protein